MFGDGLAQYKYTVWFACIRGEEVAVLRIRDPSAKKSRIRYN